MKVVCGIKDEGGHLRHGPARVCNVLAVEQKLRGLVPRARLRANPRDRPAERVAPDLIAVALLSIVAFAFIDAMKNMFNGAASGIQLGGDAIGVVKIQIGLLGLARSLQLDLEDIAEKADTSSPEGLHYVLEETVLALLRNPEYCVYGHAECAVVKGPEAAEDAFNEFSMDERGKFAEETLVNVNARKRAVSSSAAAGGDEQNINEYILVTIIAAADGNVKLPEIVDSAALRTALKRLGAIRVDALQAVEVLWTPQEEGDTLTEDELLRDYPQLNILLRRRRKGRRNDTFECLRRETTRIFKTDETGRLKRKLVRRALGRRRRVRRLRPLARTRAALPATALPAEPGSRQDHPHALPRGHRDARIDDVLPRRSRRQQRRRRDDATHPRRDAHVRVQCGVVHRRRGIAVDRARQRDARVHVADPGQILDQPRGAAKQLRVAHAEVDHPVAKRLANQHVRAGRDRVRDVLDRELDRSRRER